MKRSWLQIVGIVVAGLATTSGCGSNQSQTADATGSSAGPGAGQYSPPPTASSQGSMGGGAGYAADSDNESSQSSGSGPSGYGGPSSGGSGSGEYSYGDSYGAEAGYGGGGPGAAGMAGPSSYGPSSAGPSSYGPSSAGPSGYGQSSGNSETGSSSYDSGYGAATGYGGSGPGSMGTDGGYGSSPPNSGYGYGSQTGSYAGGLAAGTGTGSNSSTTPTKPAAPKKLSLEERSKIAFQAGNYSRAYELAYAHSLLSADAEAMKVAAAYRAAPTKSSPSLGIQVAVGLILQKPEDVTDLKPIGTDWESITGSSGGGRGAGMSGPGMGGMGEPGMPGMGGMQGMGSGPGIGGTDTNSPSGAKPLTDAAGALATDFIDAFKEHHEEGNWSVFFQSETFKGRSAVSQAGMEQSGMGGYGQGMGGMPGIGDPGIGGPGIGGPGMGGPGIGGPGIGGPGIGGPGIGAPGGAGGGLGAPGIPLQFRRQSTGLGIGGLDGSDEQDGPGMPGPGMSGPGMSGPGMSGPGMSGPSGATGAGGYGSSPDMGGYGSSPGMGGYGGVPGMGGQAGAGGTAVTSRPVIDPADIRLDRSITPLAACLHYIGSGDAKSLMETAYEGGYDVLVIFEVEVTKNRRNNVVTNTAFIRCLIPADTPKKAENIIKSRPLMNRDVAQARRKKENDGVSDVVKSVFRKLTERAALQPIPDRLTPDFVINKRLPAILESEKMSTLSKLSEINFYYHKGYLDEAQRSDFFERITSELASDILSEDLELRESAILELLNS